jgi:putative endonuclease
MIGYMYILKCSDGSYYTGSTTNLELRLQQHQNGEGANHTKKRLPVELVYYEEYARIDEAFYREKQVQGWCRKKKEALITGKPELLPKLAIAYRDLNNGGFEHFEHFESLNALNARNAPVPEVLETVPEVLETVPEVFGTVPEVLGTVPEVLETVPEALGTVPEVLETVPEVFGTVPEVLETVPEVLGTLPEVLGTVPEALGTVPEALEGTVPANLSKTKINE